MTWRIRPAAHTWQGVVVPQAGTFPLLGFLLIDVLLLDLKFIRAELHGTRSSARLEMNETETTLYHREMNVKFREATFAKYGKLTNKLAAGYSEF
ncbi:hypothetical protein V8F33_002182 [Rhypophila sp. PSN 637]